MRAVLACLCLTALGAAEGPAVETVADLHGWPGLRMNNGLVSVGVVPSWGGRCLQFDLGERPILWTDPATRGAVLEPGPAPDTHWKYINVGGFRCWPAPQSAWKRSDFAIQTWPPPPQLDHGAYVAHVSPGEITCHGPPEIHPLWRCTGLQFSYTYRLADAASLSVACTATNVALYPQRWGVWDVTAVRTGPGVEIIWPLRREGRSRFGAREWILEAGDDGDTQWCTDREAGVVRVRCAGRGGKIAGDTDGGWIALSDPGRGLAYVKRFAHDAGSWSAMKYPEGGSTVAVCTFGDSAEIEVMSPERDLDPGQSTTLAATWSACRINGMLRSANEAGVVTAPLSVTLKDGHLRCAGSYGVFVRGSARVRTNAGVILAEFPVTPLSPFVLELDAPRPAGATALELVIHTPEGDLILDRCQIHE